MSSVLYLLISITLVFVSVTNNKIITDINIMQS